MASAVEEIQSNLDQVTQTIQKIDPNIYAQKCSKIQEQIDALQDQLDALNATYVEMDGLIGQLQDSVNALDGSQTVFSGDFSGTAIDYLTRYRQKADGKLTDMIDRIQAQINKLYGDLAEAQNEQLRAEAALESAKAEIESLQHQLYEAEEAEAAEAAAAAAMGA